MVSTTQSQAQTQDTQSDDQLKHSFIAHDFIQSHLNPIFETTTTADFDLLSTIRYDPLLEEHTYLDDLILNNSNTTDDVPTSEIKVHSHTDTIIPFATAGIATAAAGGGGMTEGDLIINESNFFLFDEHVHRIEASLNYFKWEFQITKQLLLSKLIEALSLVDINLPYKCRVLINKRGELRIEIVAIPVKENLMEGFFLNDTLDDTTTTISNVWSVYIDSEPINISPFTSFKTTKRDHYSAARARSLPQNDPSAPHHEVLVYNEAKQVMEGSITNIAFKRTKIYPTSGEIIERWVTPPLSSGCLCGVVRHALINKGLIDEEAIKLESVKKGEQVLLFNGIMGVVKGIIV